MGDDLSGRVAIITGGGHGIGAGIARSLARRGAHIAIFDVNPDERAVAVRDEIRNLGQWAELYEVDVTDSGVVNTAVNAVGRVHPVIDIVVNNAGICPFQDLEHITDEMWYRTINVNLTGMFFVIRAVLPYFKKQQHGAVVNISTVSTRIATPHQVHYIASKGGVDGLTRALAVALAPFNVRVNAVAPGGVLTDINANVEEQRQAWERSGVPVSSGSWSPIPRPGTPEEMGEAVRFLVSDEARYITGAILPVDGGALIV
ncbi:MAG: SDR family NAD(P)-dependent oxidoreductase [Firmicutes bacterium]|nr:SDR family NAD(P)-dependent oxidoreductase [Bacillota bacterium]